MAVDRTEQWRTLIREARTLASGKGFVIALERLGELEAELAQSSLTVESV